MQIKLAGRERNELNEIRELLKMKAVLIARDQRFPIEIVQLKHFQRFETVANV